MKKYTVLITAALSCIISGCGGEGSYNREPTVQGPVLQNETVYVIRSSADYRKVFGNEGSVPGIDFSYHVLLVVKGETNYGIHEISSEVVHEGGVHYKLVVNIILNMAAVCQEWTQQVEAPGLPADAVIALEINYLP